MFRLREKILSVITKSLKRRDDKKREITMNVTKLEKRCSLLIATFHENLRTVTVKAFNSVIIKDTIIFNEKDNQKYLLKKDTTLITSQSVLHVLKKY